MKKCSGCKENKELNHFHKHVGRKHGVTEYCKVCRNDMIVTARFNLKPGQLKEMFQKQNNKCAICNDDRNLFIKGLAVDHCHKTGKIRGLLCSKCNIGLGQFKDDINLLNKAIKYLGENNE